MIHRITNPYCLQYEWQAKGLKNKPECTCTDKMSLCEELDIMNEILLNKESYDESNTQRKSSSNKNLDR